MSQINRLQTIDADTLQSTAYEPASFVVDDLLPQGLHLLAGAPKIGKSWLALWLAVMVAKGDPIWGMGVKQGTTLDVRHAAMRGAVPLSGGQFPAYPEPPL